MAYFIALTFTVQNVKNLQEGVKEIMSQPRPLLQDRPRLIWKIYESQSAMYRIENRQNLVFWAQKQWNQITKVFKAKF